MRPPLRSAFLLAALAAAAACGRGTAPADLPPTWVWDQGQTFVAPGSAARNLWSGWSLKGGVIEAVSRTPRLILWAKDVSDPTVRMTYTLDGPPAQAVVNHRFRRPVAIEPARVPREASFMAPLRPGLNFVEFLVEEGARLRIVSLRLGPGEAPAPKHLSEGESVTLFLEAGKGEIEWHGSGRLEETVMEGASGTLAARSRTLRTRSLSRSLRQTFALARPGILTIAAGSGAFDILRFGFTAAEKAPPPPPRRLTASDPPVILLLADGCQAAHLGVYGYGRPTSPNLERFAADAVVFENAYADAAYTRSSVLSILTGRYPETFGAGDLSVRAEGGAPTLPEFLKARGYRTSLFTSTVLISPKFGYTAGIDDYVQFTGPAEKVRERKIDLRRFGAWLRGPGPVFSYVHFIEPHFPIVAPPPFRNMFAPPGAAAERDRRERPMARLEFPTNPKNAFTRREVEEIVDDYDATIAYVDSEIGKALDEVRRAGLYDDALIIVLSDHGEALGEHGAWGHGRNVFEETARIALLVKFPSALGLRGRVRALAQGTDIFPTVLDLLGERGSLPGRSLVDIARSGDGGNGFAVSQSIAEVAQFAARWDRWYYILSLSTGRERLYDLDRDRLREAGEEAGDVRLYMRARLLDRLKRSDAGGDATKDVDLKKLTPAELEALRTLGYVR